MSKGVIRQSLQEKVSMTLLIVMGVLALLSYVTLQIIVAPAFDQLELDDARTNLIRAERAIRTDVDNLNAITGDWGLWDDAYQYVSGEYPGFRVSNLDRPTLTNLGLNLLAIYDAEQNLIWGELDHDEQAKPVSALGVLDRDRPTAEFLIRHTDLEARLSGLVDTDLGPMMVSSSPVLRSDGTGPIAGSLIMGQFLDDARAAALRERTEVSLHLLPVRDLSGPNGSLMVPINLSANGSMEHTTEGDRVVSRGILADLYGSPLLTLEVITPRAISALGKSTVDAALLFLALASVVVAIVTWLLLRRIIVLPLTGLSEHITSIRESGDLTQKLEDQRNDEIGQLGCEFDRLTDELQDARKLLLDQSFRAGKADTAAEVMHNIRNAMTPMINGIDRLSRNFAVTDRLKVMKAVDELADPDCAPERFEKLLKYIESAFRHIQTNHADAADNLAVASKQARHVEAILADQERHAQVAPVIERLNLDEVIDEAVLVIPKDEAPQVELRLEDKVHDVSVEAHRTGLLQVMGNLILNAYESIERSDAGAGLIDVKVSAEQVGEQPMVRLTVSDTGCGFDEDTSEKIFQRGYSSKEGHLSGLGLHWCANALAGMGGRIQAESEGPGRGAAFHVLLPAAQGGLK